MLCIKNNKVKTVATVCAAVNMKKQDLLQVSDEKMTSNRVWERVSQGSEKQNRKFSVKQQSYFWLFIPEK